MYSRHFVDVDTQRRENKAKWGHYHRTPAEHLLILTEEVGEIARSMQTSGAKYVWPPQYGPDTYAELVDAAAVILAMMEDCDEHHNV